MTDASRDDWFALSDDEQKVVIEEMRANGKCAARPKPDKPRTWPCGKPGGGAGGRCSWHGGLSPGGQMTAGGMFSRRMGPVLTRLFEEVMQDPELLRPEPTIGLVQTRIVQTIEGIESNDCPEYRERALELIAECEPTKELEALKDHILRGARESDGWRELVDLVQKKSGLVTAAANVALRGAEAMTKQDALAMVKRMLLSIQKQVDDPAESGRIIKGVLGDLGVDV